MSRSEPSVQKYMTCQPHAIDSRSSIAEAQSLMKELTVRHLPVVQGVKVVGILSDRDIKTACSMGGADVDKTRVGYICHENPYVVDPNAPLHDVAHEMAQHHYGCAIVVQNNNLVGIFTTVDACRALCEVLQQRFHE